MHARPITFQDFDGNQQTEVHYFNISKSELAEMELEEAFTGGLAQRLTEITQSKNARLILDTFYSIIKKAYGVRSEDGKRFSKKPELWEAFTETPAYDALYFELVTDAGKAAEFIRQVVPVEYAPKPQDHLQKTEAPVQNVELPTAQPVLQPQPEQQPYIQRPPHESGPGYYQGEAPPSGMQGWPVQNG